MLVPATSTTSEPLSPNAIPFFVCVHVGAGFHAIEKERSYRRLMSQACHAAANVLSSGGDLMKAVSQAISVLEDSELTNAGYGSNLNYDGEVECDASIMSGDGLFGSIGAASGVRNPIQVASCLAIQSQQPLSFGRVRPMYVLKGFDAMSVRFLAGDGVRRWALSQGLEAAEDKTQMEGYHVTEKAREKWMQYHDLLANSSDDVNNVPESIHDTVGCIVVNSAGEVCAGVSSGGIALKLPGRIGEAAIYGAGCWAQNADAEKKNAFSIACSVSGVGEVVTKGIIARNCVETIAKNNPLDFAKTVIQTQTAHLPDPKDVGLISVRASTAKKRGQHEMLVELCVVHNSESMGFAYLTADTKTMVGFLRHERTNGSIVEFGACAKWPLDEATVK